MYTDRRIKLNALALVVFIVLARCSVLVLAANAVPPSEIWYTSSDGKVVRPRLKAFSRNIISNTYQNGKGVMVFDGDIEVLGPSAFNGCDNLMTICLPEGVKKLETRAFMNCTSLTSISLPSSVQYIKTLVFTGCKSLRDVELPGSLEEVDGGAFQYCSSLTHLIVPDNVSAIDSFAFFDCENLEYVSLPDGLKRISEHLFDGCRKLNRIILPSRLDNIQKNAFKDCESLTEITIPTSVDYIGPGVFAGCQSLSRFHGKYATDDGRALKKDTLLIAVALAGMTQYEIPDGVTYIKQNTFQDCTHIKEIILPDSVTDIDDRAFAGCVSLECIYISENVTEIGEAVFEGCNRLRSFCGRIADNESRELIRSGRLLAVVIDGMTSFTISEGVKTIAPWVFKDCQSLERVIFPSSLKTIGEHAFEGCLLLNDIVFPPSVRSIQSDAFKDCENLRKITVESFSPPVMECRLDYVEEILVPRKALSDYKSAPGWMGYFDIMKPAR